MSTTQTKLAEWPVALRLLRRRSADRISRPSSVGGDSGSGSASEGRCGGSGPLPRTRLGLQALGCSVRFHVLTTSTVIVCGHADGVPIQSSVYCWCSETARVEARCQNWLVKSTVDTQVCQLSCEWKPHIPLSGAAHRRVLRTSGRSVQEREQEYLRARARIMGSNGGSPSEGGGLAAPLVGEQCSRCG